MASPTFAIQRIRRAQRQLDQSTQSQQVNPRIDYREILETVHQLADEETHDDLMGWVIVETVHDRKLPHPSELRDRARELCLYREIKIPDDSPLS